MSFCRLSRTVRFFVFAVLLVRWLPLPAYPEAMIQYFNTSWKELAYKMPELAEAGYNSIWLPPPQKGSGGLSVGYDHWDPFDFGSKDQRGTVRTRYGTEAELLYLMEVAHRFGIRIYFDNIMNHRAFDIPGFNEGTPLDVYPGMRPEDFHLRVTEEGFYRKWDNTRDWNDAWQVMHLGLSDLIDIAHETPNANFGTFEGASHPKIVLVRQPDHPEYYLDTDLPLPASNTVTQIGFTVYTFANKEPFDDVGCATCPSGSAGNGRFDWNDANSNGQHDAGEDSEPFTDTGLDPTRPGWNTATYGYGDGKYNMGNPAAEDVGGYLVRAVRYVMDLTWVDGLRLDAVKHVPDYFFGAFGDDVSSDGYCGQAQMQFNITRGFSDWNNHRDTIFDTEKGRDDALMFGEHLGEPPGFGGYIAAGMRLVDNPLRNHLNGVLGSPFSGLQGLDQPGAGGFAANVGVTHAQSHDNDYAAVKELQHAFYFTRAGLPLIYTDGNYQSETLGQSGGAFPRHANTAFLGQFGDNRIPNVMYLHNHFARGEQLPKWSDADVVAYERADFREPGVDNDGEAVVVMFMMNDDLSSGQYREIGTSFPNGAYLWNYADRYGRNDNGFYFTVSDNKIKSIVPPGGYFAFSWRTPEPADAWSGPGGRVMSILEDGQDTGFVSYERRDGPDGDPGFNPYGVADTNAADFTYTWFVPRIAKGSNVSVVVRTDGSAENILLKLDGGIDINSQMGLGPLAGDKRDAAPALSTDTFLGYEQMQFVQRVIERFAATNITNNVIASPGAETFHATIGSSGVANVPGGNPNDIDLPGETNIAQWVFHDPQASVISTSVPGVPQFSPPPESATGSNITLWAQVGYAFQYDRVVIYYTTNGSNPEGAGGFGLNGTRVVEMNWQGNDFDAGAGLNRDWRSGVIPPLPTNATLRYKIGVFRTGAPSRFPTGPHNAFWKKQMVTQFQATNLNFHTLTYRPHYDYGAERTGLPDGFHILQARAFLKRDGLASLYNTFPQTFYLDLETPRGEIKFPGPGDNVGNNYGMVIRTDRTANQVLVNIQDNDPINDDANTGQSNGNGTNALGQTAWAPASSVQPTLTIQSVYPDEWRFTYRNVPGGGPVAIRARLLEVSSSTNLALDDVAGHFHTITQNVTAAGDNIVMVIAFPSNDGDLVDSNYVMKVHFTDGLSQTGFTLRINGVTQGASQFQFGDVFSNSALDELGFQLPNLYNGDPNFLHHLEARHSAGGLTREAHRYVRAAPAAAGPFVNIMQPPEFDSDGKAFEIVLPDVASPQPEDRKYTIRVETDLAAQNVWIEFETNGFTAGGAALAPQVETRLPGVVHAVAGTNRVFGLATNLSGTVSATSGVGVITGAGTAFSNELAVGWTLRIDTNVNLIVTQIVSQTSLRIHVPYPGSDVTGVPAALEPRFQSALNPLVQVKIVDHTGTVAQVLSDTNFLLQAPYPGPTVTDATLFRIDQPPSIVGNRKFWDFRWTNIAAGSYRFYARVNTNDSTTAFTNAVAVRNTRVLFRQIVASTPNSLDDDDDGILDAQEENTFSLPPTNPETWTNWDVKAYFQFGRSSSVMPDTDGDGLPDGLEIGLRLIELHPSATDTNVDTNGDGWRNFMSDLDPPFYNTVPDNGCGQQPGPQYCLTGAPVPFNFNASRTMKLGGSTTDPLNPDSDYDGIPDGVEDANRNGWLDGDGNLLPPFYENPNFTSPGATPRTWPDGIRQTGETWLETNPNNPDTDGDGLLDGYGEDKNFNGWIDGDSNSNRIYNAGELWSETDPLNRDTDGDGLPDGWEVQYNFDPLNPGIPGWTNLRTAAIVTTNEFDTIHGPLGNPDNDFLIIEGVTNVYNNLLEFQNGTNPRFSDDQPPPEGSVTIGRGEPIGVINGVTNYQEFTDWTADDCKALDEYEGDGPNNQQGDTYLGWDGFDTSRDIVAFYARDGGDIGLGGDGRVYFRLDFFDLQPLAEQANLDIYIVIDFGSPGQGERKLPDDVDTLTDMQWEAVVAAYHGNVGRVYMDMNSSQNTVSFGDDLFGFGGVIARDQNDADGFLGSYYNSELDAVEIAISRKALTDIGWGGNPNQLNYQVFTTRDGTQNSPQGAGDIGGRTDIRDTILDDYLAEDYFFAQGGIDSILRSWIPHTWQCGEAKVASVVHGNQAIQPGSVIQNLINNGAGAGYHRLLEIHDLYDQPVNLHLTATLASALEWAKVDPAFGTPWRDGPSFNRRIGALIQTNVVYLMGSTFSDHILPYFTKAYNRDNERLAREFLEDIYRTTIDTNTAFFWTPERVLDADVFDKIKDLGYKNTLMDQMLHMRTWFGRETALGNDGYRLNRIHGVNVFNLNDQVTAFRFQNNDNGLNLPMRRLFSGKARSGEQQQVVTLFYSWEEFGSLAQANAYDRNLRWIANRPWIRMVALEEIAGSWFALDRSAPVITKVSHDFIHHASRENYDNWYVGLSGAEHGLLTNRFAIRPGVPVPAPYGMLFTGGIVSQAWTEVDAVTDTNLSKLARGIIHASTFETAFHDEDNNNLSKFSTGDYIYPDTSFDTLAAFTRQAQAQSRMAAILNRVDTWAAGPSLTPATSAEDVDFDGENEYLLYNDRLFGVFERIGGRLVAVWVRDILNGEVFQAAGNLVGFAGSDSEWEGAFNIHTNTGALEAYRTSCLKDWWYADSSSFAYVNDLYTAQDLTNGWRFASSDNNIIKSITLAPKSWQFAVTYQVAAGMLFVRNGFSPNLFNLLKKGQETLGAESHADGVMQLANTNYVTTVSGFIGYGDAGHNAAYVADATDHPARGTNAFTVNMRNQAQTHQAEISGSGTFSFSLGFRAKPSDGDGDGLPNTYEDLIPGLDAGDPGDGAAHNDADGMDNLREYISGTDPNDGADYHRLASASNATAGISIRFPTKTPRDYYIYYDNQTIDQAAWSLATSNAIPGTGGLVEWVDDGTATSPHPSQQTNRVYRIDVSLPR
jgi:hypothetical protein